MSFVRQAFIVASMLVVASCSDGGAVPQGDASVDADAVVPSVNELRSTRARAAPSGADVSALGRSGVSFGLALHRAATQSGTNTVISPHGVSVALAMARAGALGATGTEIDGALRVTLTTDRMHQGFNATAQALAGRAAEATARDAEPTVPRPALVLNVVNDLWAQLGLSVAPAYLDTLAEFYGAGVRVVDFAANPELARGMINDRVSTLTMDRIPMLIPRGQITDRTRVVLTNAVYFNARWEARFNPEYTRDGAFTRTDGTVASAHMMAHPTRQSLPYARGDGWQAVEMPYVGRQVAMLVVVPDAGAFADFERALDIDRYETIVSALGARLVSLRLPRFSIRLPLLLKAPLQSLGVSLAFSDLADFSALAPREPLKISEVVHEGFIEVTEAGTEAAAATAVVFVDGGIGPDFVSLTVDRPFYYFIRDRETGALLFMGRVLDPTRS